jgi:hypothetical protein
MNMERITAWFERYGGPRISPKNTLLLGTVVFGVLVIVLGNLGKLPFRTGDFLFLSFLFFLFALYRPAWAFLSFVSVLPFEIVNFAPVELPMNLRPYQLFGALLALALLVLFARKKFPVRMIAFARIDIFPLLIVLGGFLGAVNAPDPKAAFRQAVIVLSFGLLYLLGRIFIRREGDMRTVLRFLLASSVLVALYAVLQNLRFLGGNDPFEMMPGRPNGTFLEPDWLGMYLVFFGAMLFSIFAQAFQGRSLESLKDGPWKPLGIAVLLTLFFSVLLMTVSRSAWLGALVMAAVSSALFAYRERRVKSVGMYAAGIALSFLLALTLVVLVPLTRFDLLGRAGSIGNGLQEITVACDSADTALPMVLHTMDELTWNGCRHIDLERIGTEQADGKSIMTVFRPDPNVNIRKEIYAKSLGEIAKHPILGIGWGSISAVLGTDARGAGLNASNIFLETWLGSGLLGLIGLIGLLGTIFFRSAQSFLRDRNPEATFILAVFTGLIVVNLFNAGLLQGYVWILFAMAAQAGNNVSR